METRSDLTLSSLRIDPSSDNASVAALDVEGPVTMTKTLSVTGATTFSSAPLMTGIQRVTTDSATTILSTTSYVDLAANVTSSRVVTMPSATAGRRVRVMWSVEQAGNDRVFTRAGSDTFVGNILTRVEGNAAGDGDVVSVPSNTISITCVDDVNIGSYLDFECLQDGKWFVTGILTIVGIDSLPTVANS